MCVQVLCVWYKWWQGNCSSQMVQAGLGRALLFSKPSFLSTPKSPAKVPILPTCLPFSPPCFSNKRKQPSEKKEQKKF